MEPARAGVAEEHVAAPELVEIVVETAAEAGVTGISLAGGGKEGIYVSDVQRDSSAAKALRLREGDQLLSARVFFENVRYEDAVRLLQCAEACKVSFCLKRTVPSTDAAVHPSAAGSEAKEPKAKMARLNIKSLTPLKKKKVVKAPVVAAVPGAKLDTGPVDVEFSLPKFSRLMRGWSAAAAGAAAPAPAGPPEAAAAAVAEAKRTRLAFSRLTVREAVAGKAAALEVEEPRAKLEVALPRGGAEPAAPKSPPAFGKEEPGAEGEAKFRAPQVELDVPLPGLGAPAALPAVDVAAPKVDVGLSLPGAAPPAVPAPPEPGPRAPVLEIAVQPPALELQLPTARREPEPAPVPAAAWEAPSIAVKVPKIALPKLGGKAGQGEAAGEPEGDAAARESPKAKGPRVKLPSLGISLPAAPEPAARTKLPAVKVPTIDIALPSAAVELVSAEPLPPPEPEPGKFGVPKLDLSVPGAKALAAELPKGALPKPELGIAVEQPRVEVKLPAARVNSGSLEPAPARLSFPEVPVPALDIAVPAVAVGLELPAAREPAPQPAAEGPEGAGGPGLGAVVARIPRVDISVGRAKPEEAAEPDAATAVERGLRRLSLELEVPGTGTEAAARGSGADGKPKPSKFALPRFGAAGPKARKSAEGEPAASPEGGAGGAKLRMPKLSLPRLGGKDKEGEPAAESRAAEAPARKAKFKMPSFGAARREAEEPGPALPEGAADGSGCFLAPEVGIKLPQVELPGLGAGGRAAPEPPEPGDAWAPRVPSVGVALPAVELDISLPRASADGTNRPAEDAGTAESHRKMPQVELSLEGPRERSSSAEPANAGASGSPRMRVPRLDIALPKARLSDTELPLTAAGGSFRMPSLGLPKFPKGKAPEPEPEPGWGGDPAAAGWRGWTKLPRFGGSSPDVRGAGAPEAPDAGSRAPSLPAGFAAEPEPPGPEGKFRLKVPALGLGKAGAGADAQPLCPPAPGAPLPCRLPHVSIPDVGFSAEGKPGRGGEPEREAGGLEARLKVPKIRLPAAVAEAEGKRPALKVPELELAAPGEGEEPPPPPGAEAEAGKRRRVKLPRFGIALPRGAPEGGEEARARVALGVRKAVLELVRPKGRGAEGAAGLLEGGGGGGEGRAAKPGSGRLRKPGAGAEVNGEAEEGARLRLPLPRLELAAPARPAAPDPELSLRLVKPEEPEEPEPPRAGTLAALKSLRAPRLALGAARRRDGEAVVASAARTELAVLERAAAAPEPPPAPAGFRLPKVTLSPQHRADAAAPRGRPGSSGRPQPAAT
ncbi:periaxin [Apteryx mantelli]|uniref:Periaxin n=1 Tax=Apteryx mantelli TaxID=2696672 RepID=A0ABM4G072_9AVES